MNIPLTPDIERALSEHARRLGTTPERLAIDSLREHFVATVAQSPTENGGTLAGLLHEHIGVLRSSDHVPGGARMSESSGEKFSAGLVQSRRDDATR